MLFKLMALLCLNKRTEQNNNKNNNKGMLKNNALPTKEIAKSLQILNYY